MANIIDDLENNPFYLALEQNYITKLKEAQRKCWLICVPISTSLSSNIITKEFIDTHVLKPSPFFKSHFVTTDVNKSYTFEIDGNNIKTSSGIIKILKEETSYNDDYKPYRIIMIEQPLTNIPKQEEKISKSSDKKELFLSLHECSSFLKSFQECSEIMKSLNKKIQIFITSYIVLPKYLEDASLKLQDLLQCSLNEFNDALVHRSSANFSKLQISIALENYIMHHTHEKLFPVIRKFCSTEDKIINEQLLKLYESQVTPDQLGVQDKFCCQPLSAIVELASLNSRCNPGEKLQCLINTLELLNQDIEQFLAKSSNPVKSNIKDSSYLTSDDLIPLLVYVIAQARPQYLASNLYYVQHFRWESSPSDKLSYSLVTFQAVKEFLKNTEFDCLKPPTRKVKKEMSLEELIEVTIDFQHSAKLSEPRASTTDYLLQDVTKMIEASTRELQNHPLKSEPCLSQQNKIAKSEAEQKDNVGDFLSSLRQSSLGLSYGKQK